MAQDICALGRPGPGHRGRATWCVASTGVIGQALPIEPIQTGIPDAAAKLEAAQRQPSRRHRHHDHRHPSQSRRRWNSPWAARPCRLGAIAKGTGMIHPNMATMLRFITTDCRHLPERFCRRPSPRSSHDTFNMISRGRRHLHQRYRAAVLANGLAGNPVIADRTRTTTPLWQALTTVCRARSAEQLAGDGEGRHQAAGTAPSRHAATLEIARAVAKSVICSTLFKAAMFGADANWGRVLCAIGYTPARISPSTKIAVRLALQGRGGLRLRERRLPSRTARRRPPRS